MPNEIPEPSSFRDNAGFLFRSDGVLLRQVNAAYQREYRVLTESGLASELVAQGLLIPTETLSTTSAMSAEAIAVLKPEVVPFISYPYEWPFHAVKDAALATLKIQKLAMEKGMVLRDASAFNIQFLRGKPVLIDSLSFGIYEEGKPWQAYKQFCQHFLAPLVLMAYVDPRLGRLSQAHLDGIPLDLAAKLAPRSTKWNFGLGMHLHAHGRSQAQATASEKSSAGLKVSKTALLGLIDTLESTIHKIEPKAKKTTWSNYYEETNYSSEAMSSKHELVTQFLSAIPGPIQTAWDLGANTGEFSALATQRGANTIAWDFDHECVDAHYQQLKGKNAAILPLVLDLTNPSPAIGWAHEERMSLAQRGPADVIMALALVHHLAIGNNVPLSRIAEFFAQIGTWAIVEFIPKEDSQTQRLLAHREDVFPNYTQCDFEKSFASHFDLLQKLPVQGSSRTLYLFRKRKPD